MNVLQFVSFFFGYVDFVCITNAFLLNCIFEKFLNVRSLFVFNSLSHPLIFKICVNQLLMSVLLYPKKKKSSRSGIVVVVVAVIMLWKCSKFISNAFRLTHLKNVYSCVRPSVCLSYDPSVFFWRFSTALYGSYYATLWLIVFTAENYRMFMHISTFISSDEKHFTYI